MIGPNRAHFCLVQQHAAAFFAEAAQAMGASLRQFVKDEFDAFLERGRLKKVLTRRIVFVQEEGSTRRRYSTFLVDRCTIKRTIGACPNWMPLLIPPRAPILLRRWIEFATIMKP